MQFMLLIYDDPAARKEMQPQDWAALAEADLRYRREIPRSAARLLGSQVLELPKDAVTLSFSKGEITRAQGPAVDTGEWLAGFYLIECDNKEVAAQVASNAPMPDGCGRVEVRPVMARAQDAENT